jgi:hypothetical protein
MPWNPMRLVQRHGRIDRIGSPHSRVYMRTIFPVDRLDELLNLEARILNKLAMAAASVGVSSPLDGGQSGNQVFSETREEIERLLKEDNSIYERGGTISSSQSGEEYRQTLRKALNNNKELIVSLPWKSGSGMVSGSIQGFFFCSKVGERTYLRFIKTNSDWVPFDLSIDADEIKIISEIGTCLRLIECSDDAELIIDDSATDNVFDSWEIVKFDIWKNWMHETDPVNLQPKVRPLNLKVANHLRKHIPEDVDKDKFYKSLDILESPWSRRDESLLRQWFDSPLEGSVKSKYLVDNILDSGLEPAQAVEPLPPIQLDDIELLVWMAVKPSS